MHFNIIEKEINYFVKKYQSNPFEFLTEYDIQSYLWFKIFENFEKNHISVHIKISDEDLKVKKYNPSQSIKVNPVRREYPAGETFDIAIINSENIKKQMSGYWHQPLICAIELKYHRSSKDYINELIKKFYQDIDKLYEYSKTIKKEKNFCGIAILFIQNESNDKEEEFKNLFQDNYISIDKILIEKGINGFVVTKNHIYKINKKSFG